MHVNAKKIALAGLLVAFTAVLMLLSSLIETNSLFLIAAASFCVGIAIREWGVPFGMGFLVASALVNLLIVSNKMYCITFAAMGLYLLLTEFLWEKIAAKKKMKSRTLALWIGKYVIFNCFYVPALLLFQELLFVKEMTGGLLVVCFLVGQIVLLIYDKVYMYFQSAIWGKLRMRLMKE